MTCSPPSYHPPPPGRPPLFSIIPARPIPAPQTHHLTLTWPTDALNEWILLLSQQKMLKRVEGVKLALRLDDRIVVTERTRPWRARARAFVTVHSNAF